MHNEYPTDRINFEDTIKNNYVKRCILTYGPCRPDIVFPKTTKEDGKSIHFSKFYYNKTLKSGIQHIDACKVRVLWVKARLHDDSSTRQSPS
jgi:hypothetical protein